MNNKNSGHLQAFLSHIKELNDSPEEVSQILKENAIDETQLEEQGKALADGLIRQLQKKEKAGKVISISSWKWVAAAVLVGLIALSTLWWYRQREKKEQIAINQKKGNTKFIEDKEKENTATTTLGRNTAASQVAIPSVFPRLSPAIARASLSY